MDGHSVGGRLRLVFGQPAVQLAAQELLDRQSESVRSFGHQATIHRLLSVTPELGLYGELRRAFIRRALYENALRNH